ncbi:hypothetical protein [Bacillus subtilis]|uniref:hypothetical protein n=1 Tax=Bacillus subtilis TaxID=1423 RepID=UPI0026773264|nr:hypothetical protein [Bacillus subtilis]MDO3653544.1 hypothetical protein [Bacillus subtilis]
MNRKQKVKNECANYKDGLCLIRDTECPLVAGFTYRGYQVPEEDIQCDYFNMYVDLIPKEDIKSLFSYKDCETCGKSDKPRASANKFCSNGCHDLSRKKTHRKYNEKR